MITRISDWGGCTPLTGENNYSRNPLTGSYPGSSKKRGVSTSETQGICNGPGTLNYLRGVFPPLKRKGYATPVYAYVYE